LGQVGNINRNSSDYSIDIFSVRALWEFPWRRGFFLFVEGFALDKQKIKPQITANPKEPQFGVFGVWKRQDETRIFPGNLNATNPQSW
jgi:hypothetical protein